MRRQLLRVGAIVLARRILTCAAVRTVEQPDSPRILKVAVLGSPNVGKSTLINKLIGKKVAAVSDKPQTTRESCLAVLTKGNAQILLTDTPGVVHYRFGRRHKMPKSLVSGAMVSLQGTDLAAVVVDLSNKRQRMTIDQSVVKLLEEHRTIPSVLVLNKLDSVRDRFSMLPTIDNLTCGQLLSPLEPGENGVRYMSEADEHEVLQPHRGWPNFHEVLIVSARTGEGLDRLQDYLFSLAYPGPWLYNSDESVALPPLKIIEELVREQIFAHLYQELPYVITQTNLLLSRRSDNVLEIHQALNCRKECQKAIIIGKDALTVQSMTREAERHLEQLFGPVHLRLIVRVTTRSY